MITGKSNIERAEEEFNRLLELYKTPLPIPEIIKRNRDLRDYFDQTLYSIGGTNCFYPAFYLFLKIWFAVL